MTKEEFVETTGVSAEAVVLEDWETFSKGIIGVASGGKRVVYGFSKLAYALADSYLEAGDCDDETEAMTAALEWLDFNTMRSLPYVDADVRPIIVYELEEE